MSPTGHMHWEAMRAHCASEDAELASIHSANEIDFLANMVRMLSSLKKIYVSPN